MHLAWTAQTSTPTTRSLALTLGVSAVAPLQPTLFAPVDTSTGVKVRPLLSWGTAGPSDRIFGDGFEGVPLQGPPSGALSYTVEVATDSGFTNIVTSATVTTTSWTVDIILSDTTQYFWHVIPHNYCGDGPTSATFSFTTGVPGQCPTGTTPSTVYPG